MRSILYFVGCRKYFVSVVFRLERKVVMKLKGVNRIQRTYDIITKKKKTLHNKSKFVWDKIFA